MVFHRTVPANRSMPGANCSMYGCGTSRKHKDIGIFKLPLPKDDFHRKWRQDLIDIILRYRVLDVSLKRQINEDRIHICQRHFSEDQFYVYPSRKLLKEGALPTLNLLPTTPSSQPVASSGRRKLSVNTATSILNEGHQQVPPKSKIKYTQFKQKTTSNNINQTNSINNNIDENATNPESPPRTPPKKTWTRLSPPPPSRPTDTIVSQTQHNNHDQRGTPKVHQVKCQGSDNNDDITSNNDNKLGGEHLKTSTEPQVSKNKARCSDTSQNNHQGKLPSSGIVTSKERSSEVILVEDTPNQESEKILSFTSHTPPTFFPSSTVFHFKTCSVLPTDLKIRQKQKKVFFYRRRIPQATQLLLTTTTTTTTTTTPATTTTSATTVIYSSRKTHAPNNSITTLAGGNPRNTIHNSDCTMKIQHHRDGASILSAKQSYLSRSFSTEYFPHVENDGDDIDCYEDKRADNGDIINYNGDNHSDYGNHEGIERFRQMYSNQQKRSLSYYDEENHHNGTSSKIPISQHHSKLDQHNTTQLDQRTEISRQLSHRPILHSMSYPYRIGRQMPSASQRSGSLSSPTPRHSSDVDETRYSDGSSWHSSHETDDGSDTKLARCYRANEMRLVNDDEERLSRSHEESEMEIAMNYEADGMSLARGYTVNKRSYRKRGSRYIGNSSRPDNCFYQEVRGVKRMRISSSTAHRRKSSSDILLNEEDDNNEDGLIFPRSYQEQQHVLKQDPPQRYPSQQHGHETNVNGRDTRDDILIEDRSAVNISHNYYHGASSAFYQKGNVTGERPKLSSASPPNRDHLSLLMRRQEICDEENTSSSWRQDIGPMYRKHRLQNPKKQSHQNHHLIQKVGHSQERYQPRPRSYQDEHSWYSYQRNCHQYSPDGQNNDFVGKHPVRRHSNADRAIESSTPPELVQEESSEQFCDVTTMEHLTMTDQSKIECPEFVRCAVTTLESSTFLPNLTEEPTHEQQTCHLTSYTAHRDSPEILNESFQQFNDVKTPPDLIKTDSSNMSPVYHYGN